MTLFESSVKRSVESGACAPGGPSVPPDCALPSKQTGAWALPWSRSLCSPHWAPRGAALRRGWGRCRGGLCFPGATGATGVPSRPGPVTPNGSPASRVVSRFWPRPLGRFLGRGSQVKSGGRPSKQEHRAGTGLEGRPQGESRNRSRVWQGPELSTAGLTKDGSVTGGRGVTEGSQEGDTILILGSSIWLWCGALGLHWVDLWV